MKANPFLIWEMGAVGRLINKLGANFRWQHLPVPFEVYADGIDLVIFEEFGSGAEAMHLKESMERNELLATKRTGGLSARTTKASTGSGSGTVISSMPRSSIAPKD